MLTEILIVVSFLCFSNAQFDQQTSTLTPVRYALVLRELAEVTRGRTALQAKVQQMREAYDLLERKTATERGINRTFLHHVVL